MRRALAASVLVAVLVAGCGGGLHLLGKTSQAKPAPSAFGGQANRSSVAVIRGWANALRSGDIARAASYFALPSLYANGVDARGNLVVLKIRSRAGAVIVNRQLPCGAVVIAAMRHGPYIRAIFRLTGRPGPGGTSCTPGAGSEASTFFLIRGGKIADWIRGPDVPGGGTGTSTGPGASPQPPSTTIPGGGVPVA